MIKIASFYIVTTGSQYLKTQLERIKKNLQNTVKNIGLEILAEPNLRIVKYLDVTLTFTTAGLDLATNEMILVSTLTKNPTTLFILLSTCQHLLKNDFQTILPLKKCFKN